MSNRAGKNTVLYVFVFCYTTYSIILISQIQKCVYYIEALLISNPLKEKENLLIAVTCDLQLGKKKENYIYICTVNYYNAIIGVQNHITLIVGSH